MTNMPGTRRYPMADIPFVVTQDKDGLWNAHVQLWEGARADGERVTADEAIKECAAGLKLMFEHFAEELPGERGHVPTQAEIEQFLRD